MAVPRIVDLRRGVLEKNDILAAELRDRYASAELSVSNWVSSPGSGKTALLARVLTGATDRGIAAAALVGDCASDNDAQRLASTGVPVRQIVTEGMCHLEADIVGAHLVEWDLSTLDVLVIENVGNLVCPTSYDLGEGIRVALLSVTEGEDKPVKYPQLFSSADVIVITKIDLAQAVEFDEPAAMAAIRSVNPTAPVLKTSARTGDGVVQLIDHLLAAAAPGGSS